jgi:hypothetical protein
LITVRIFLAAILCTAALVSPAVAEEKVLYCVVEQTVGIAASGDEWKPAYSDGSTGKRYTIL